MPKVLNRSALELTPGAVNIMRPSKWGNPYRIGRDGNREQVLALYRTFLTRRPDLIEAAKRELRGRDLVCCCAPRACHGDILLELANV
jgi:hypothetical protein